VPLCLPYGSTVDPAVACLGAGSGHYSDHESALKMRHVLNGEGGTYVRRSVRLSTFDITKSTVKTSAFPTLGPSCTHEFADLYMETRCAIGHL
jgi:hypothetical protein